MAEFKLGRIRFVWKGDWNAATIYYKDDIVRNGGNTYICVAGHTSPEEFTTDQAVYWNKISDGTEWKGDWRLNEYYKENDIVKYGGYLYIANTAHTSATTISAGLEFDQNKWDLFAEGFDYKANWEISTRYKINDIVKYNGTVYLCTVPHTSASTESDGLELDQNKWDIFSAGMFWKDIWETSVRYRTNDVVRYGGQLYVCNTGHTSASTAEIGLEADQSKWDYFHKGFEYKGDWTNATRYKINDLVKYGGGIWICTTFHTSTTSLAADESNWAQFVEGLEFEDSWESQKQYQPGDFVTYGGYSYVAVTNNVASKPSDNPADWDLFTTGFRFIGEYDDDSTQREYIEGDVVRLGGYTYLCILKHTGQRPPNTTYWERLNSGINWEGAWTDATFYDAGDAVSHGVNSYICILAHTADEVVDTNRPDQDVLGTYWNVLSGGPESGNLTEEGDIVYYSGAGPTRLPIGAPGQILKVNNAGNAPEWDFYGQVNFVYYVETNGGVDEPAPSYGVTLDRPWKTVRYATEQIEYGALRPNARKLLEANRSFIQAEIVEWVDYQIANSIAPFTAGFTYDKTLCQRDMGLLVDALVYDLTHGGNRRVREAAIAYYTEGGISYIAGQEAETVAAINYGIEVIDAVLTNFDPAANYQTLNSVPTPITQVKDAAIVEESDAQTLTEQLISVVTSAIVAGNVSSIPAEKRSNSTIFVKTGEFAEVLPIIVPANTAIVGDELRSTRIVPAESLIDSSDTPYTLDTITRLASIMGDIVTNTPVTPTAGNTATQNVSRPSGSVQAGVDAANLWTQIHDYIDYLINGATADSTVPVVTGSNQPISTTDYTYAVEVIEANREFLVAEATAYIAATYPGYTYNSAACERDIQRYIDAIKHDLRYTGNYKSLLFAKYYVNAVLGSTTEDMFYMRSGTGLRNCTVKGLSGILSSDNQYGTKRPTAGAFVSLDPGWGPEHQEVWIYARSPYVQNVTTFGTGCIGCKIDGALHAGGNDSIVANDFTQILSDGIGVWCTNLGRTELVSVFTYYNYIGYLAEDGGKIRATNGNNSYGAFGSVAEGVDVSEVPITGSVNNRSTEALVDRVLTNSNNILIFEYLNAGVNYSDTVTAIKTITVNPNSDNLRKTGTYYNVTGTSSGSGTGQQFTVVVDDLGVASVFEIVNGGTGHAATDVITVSAAEIGGTGSGFNIIVDSIGNSTDITITGEGFGASIDNVTVVDGGVYEVRMLDTADNFGGAGYITSSNVAQVGDSTSITISNTDVRINSQYVGMAVYITAGVGTGQFGYIQSYNSGTKTAVVHKISDNTPGWDHVVPGTPIEPLLNDTTTYSIEPRVIFDSAPSGLEADRATGRAVVEDGKIVKVLIINPGSGYQASPLVTFVDPNNTVDAPVIARIGDGVLGQPIWISRGNVYSTAQAAISGYGYADMYQTGQFISIEGLSDMPIPGSNVEINTLPGKYFKLVSVTNLLGFGPYTARLQVSPEISISDAPEHGDEVSLRIRYSQVRLTGHDFLDIGTGNFDTTNYPGVPEIPADPSKETNDFGGGRVFYTSTDQDGNFRVGGLFNVEQSTGVATLNADAFNISGLQELQLGAVGLGGTGAVITEFSTDGTFTANSDNIVPTQKAIRTYITSQIGGGAGELNVNTITAGVIKISTNEITTVTDDSIRALQKINFEKGVDGHPLAMNYFLQQ